MSKKESKESKKDGKKDKKTPRSTVNDVTISLQPQQSSFSLQSLSSSSINFDFDSFSGFDISGPLGFSAPAPYSPNTVIQEQPELAQEPSFTKKESKKEKDNKKESKKSGKDPKEGKKDKKSTLSNPTDDIIPLDPIQPYYLPFTLTNKVNFIEIHHDIYSSNIFAPSVTNTPTKYENIYMNRHELNTHIQRIFMSNITTTNILKNSDVPGISDGNVTVFKAILVISGLLKDMLKIYQMSSHFPQTNDSIEILNINDIVPIIPSLLHLIITVLQPIIKLSTQNDYSHSVAILNEGKHVESIQPYPTTVRDACLYHLFIPLLQLSYYNSDVRYYIFNFYVSEWFYLLYYYYNISIGNNNTSNDQNSELYSFFNLNTCTSDQNLTTNSDEESYINMSQLIKKYEASPQYQQFIYFPTNMSNSQTTTPNLSTSIQAICALINYYSYKSTQNLENDASAKIIAHNKKDPHSVNLSYYFPNTVDLFVMNAQICEFYYFQLIIAFNNAGNTKGKKQAHSNVQQVNVYSLNRNNSSELLLANLLVNLNNYILHYFYIHNYAAKRTTLIPSTKATPHVFYVYGTSSDAAILSPSIVQQYIALMENIFVGIIQNSGVLTSQDNIIIDPVNIYTLKKVLLFCMKSICSMLYTVGNDDIYTLFTKNTMPNDSTMTLLTAFYSYLLNYVYFVQVMSPTVGSTHNMTHYINNITVIAQIILFLFKKDYLPGGEVYDTGLKSTFYGYLIEEDDVKNPKKSRVVTFLSNLYTFITKSIIYTRNIPIYQLILSLLVSIPIDTLISYTKVNFTSEWPQIEQSRPTLVKLPKAHQTTIFFESFYVNIIEQLWSCTKLPLIIPHNKLIPIISQECSTSDDKWYFATSPTMLTSFMELSDEKTPRIINSVVNKGIPIAVQSTSGTTNTIVTDIAFFSQYMHIFEEEISQTTRRVDYLYNTIYSFLENCCYIIMKLSKSNESVKVNLYNFHVIPAIYTLLLLFYHNYSALNANNTYFFSFLRLILDLLQKTVFSLPNDQIFINFNIILMKLLCVDCNSTYASAYCFNQQTSLSEMEQNMYYPTIPISPVVLNTSVSTTDTIGENNDLNLVVILFIIHSLYSTPRCRKSTNTIGNAQQLSKNSRVELFIITPLLQLSYITFMQNVLFYNYLLFFNNLINLLITNGQKNIPKVAISIFNDPSMTNNRDVIDDLIALLTTMVTNNQSGQLSSMPSSHGIIQSGDFASIFALYNNASLNNGIIKKTYGNYTVIPNNQLQNDLDPNNYTLQIYKDLIFIQYGGVANGDSYSKMSELLSNWTNIPPFLQHIIPSSAVAQTNANINPSKIKSRQSSKLIPPSPSFNNSSTVESSTNHTGKPKREKKTPFHQFIEQNYHCFDKSLNTSPQPIVEYTAIQEFMITTIINTVNVICTLDEKINTQSTQNEQSTQLSIIQELLTYINTYQPQFAQSCNILTPQPLKSLTIIHNPDNIDEFVTVLTPSISSMGNSDYTHWLFLLKTVIKSLFDDKTAILTEKVQNTQQLVRQPLFNMRHTTFSSEFLKQQKLHENVRNKCDEQLSMSIIDDVFMLLLNELCHFFSEKCENRLKYCDKVNEIDSIRVIIELLTTLLVPRHDNEQPNQFLLQLTTINNIITIVYDTVTLFFNIVNNVIATTLQNTQNEHNISFYTILAFIYHNQTNTALKHVEFVHNCQCPSLSTDYSTNCVNFNQLMTQRWSFNHISVHQHHDTSDQLTTNNILVSMINAVSNEFYEKMGFSIDIIPFLCLILQPILINVPKSFQTVNKCSIDTLDEHDFDDENLNEEISSNAVLFYGLDVHIYDIYIILFNLNQLNMMIFFDFYELYCYTTQQYQQSLPFYHRMDDYLTYSLQNNVVTTTSTQITHFTQLLQNNIANILTQITTHSFGAVNNSNTDYFLQNYAQYRDLTQMAYTLSIYTPQLIKNVVMYQFITQPHNNVDSQNIASFWALLFHNILNSTPHYGRIRKILNNVATNTEDEYKYEQYAAFLPIFIVFVQVVQHIGLHTVINMSNLLESQGLITTQQQSPMMVILDLIVIQQQYAIQYLPQIISKTSKNINTHTSSPIQTPKKSLNKEEYMTEGNEMVLIYKSIFSSLSDIISPYYNEIAIGCDLSQKLTCFHGEMLQVYDKCDLLSNFLMIMYNTLDFELTYHNIMTKQQNGNNKNIQFVTYYWLFARINQYITSNTADTHTNASATFIITLFSNIVYTLSPYVIISHQITSNNSPAFNPLKTQKGTSTHNNIVFSILELDKKQSETCFELLSYYTSDYGHIHPHALAVEDYTILLNSFLNEFKFFFITQPATIQSQVDSVYFTSLLPLYMFTQQMKSIVANILDGDDNHHDVGSIQDENVIKMFNNRMSSIITNIAQHASLNDDGNQWFKTPELTTFVFKLYSYLNNNDVEDSCDPITASLARLLSVHKAGLNNFLVAQLTREYSDTFYGLNLDSLVQYLDCTALLPVDKRTLLQYVYDKAFSMLTSQNIGSSDYYTQNIVIMQLLHKITSFPASFWGNIVTQSHTDAIKFYFFSFFFLYIISFLMKNVNYMVSFQNTINTTLTYNQVTPSSSLSNNIVKTLLTILSFITSVIKTMRLHNTDVTIGLLNAEKISTFFNVYKNFDLSNQEWNKIDDFFTKYSQLTLDQYMMLAITTLTCDLEENTNISIIGDLSGLYQYLTLLTYPEHGANHSTNTNPLYNSDVYRNVTSDNLINTLHSRIAQHSNTTLNDIVIIIQELMMLYIYNYINQNNIQEQVKTHNAHAFYYNSSTKQHYFYLKFLISGSSHPDGEFNKIHADLISLVGLVPIHVLQFIIPAYHSLTNALNNPATRLSTKQRLTQQFTQFSTFSMNMKQKEVNYSSFEALLSFVIQPSTLLLPHYTNDDISSINNVTNFATINAVQHRFALLLLNIIHHSCYINTKCHLSILYQHDSLDNISQNNDNYNNISYMLIKYNLIDHYIISLWYTLIESSDYTSILSFNQLFYNFIFNNNTNPNPSLQLHQNRSLTTTENKNTTAAQQKKQHFSKSLSYVSLNEKDSDKYVMNKYQTVIMRLVHYTNNVLMVPNLPNSRIHYDSTINYSAQFDPHIEEDDNVDEDTTDQFNLEQYGEESHYYAALTSFPLLTAVFIDLNNMTQLFVHPLAQLNTKATIHSNDIEKIDAVEKNNVALTTTYLSDIVSMVYNNHNNNDDNPHCSQLKAANTFLLDTHTYNIVNINNFNTNNKYEIHFNMFYTHLLLIYIGYYYPLIIQRNLPQFNNTSEIYNYFSHFLYKPYNNINSVNVSSFAILNQHILTFNNLIVLLLSPIIIQFTNYRLGVEIQDKLIKNTPNKSHDDSDDLGFTDTNMFDMTSETHQHGVTYLYKRYNNTNLQLDNAHYLTIPQQVNNASNPVSFNPLSSHLSFNSNSTFTKQPTSPLQTANKSTLQQVANTYHQWLDNVIHKEVVIIYNILETSNDGDMFSNAKDNKQPKKTILSTFLSLQYSPSYPFNLSQSLFSTSSITLNIDQKTISSLLLPSTYHQIKTLLHNFNNQKIISHGDNDSTPNTHLSAIAGGHSLLSLFSTNYNNIINTILVWYTILNEAFSTMNICAICMASVDNSHSHGKDSKEMGKKANTLSSTKKDTIPSLPSVQCEVCENYYHPHCIFEWFSSNGKSSCPLCRASF